MNRRLWLGLIVTVFVVGCATPSTIPSIRDYEKTSKVDIEELETALREAAMQGGAVAAPFEIHSAQQYLILAKEFRGKGEDVAANDFASTAKSLTEAAVRKAAVFGEDQREIPATKDDCRREIDRMKKEYLGVDAEKAASVAPILYSRLMVLLSVGEHELAAGRVGQAGVVLAEANAYWQALREQDTDHDGIPDLEDGAPYLPEDKDGFEDEDGIPDPDNDQDGILDLNDKAPNEPETKNRFHDDDGVPDEYPKLKDVYFDLDTGSISAESRGYLSGLAMVLNEWPLLKLNITGFSSGSADLQQNLDDAHKKAMLVHDWLVQEGCNPNQLEVSFREGSSVANGRYVQLEFR